VQLGIIFMDGRAYVLEKASKRNPIRALAFAYFSFRVRRVEFVSWSRSCCWLGCVRVQFMCFSHRLHQTLAVVTNFTRVVPVLSYISESVLKTTITFTYKLRLARSL